MGLFINEGDLLPRLICNNPNRKSKVISELIKCFERCETFNLSVAFISDSGLASLRQTLIDLKKKGIKGRIVTSTYLGFNNPNMFRQLLELNNIDIRIYLGDGFHPKGYIFQYEDAYKIIIGSSNLTQNALSVNQEWNICLTSFANSEIIERVVYEYEQQWLDSIPLTSEWIDEYEKAYVEPTANDPVTNSNRELTPNRMQEEALLNLDELRRKNENKALLISATGTGKTLLSAFDVKQFNAAKMLFVIHRENIARKAIEAYKLIFPNKTFGLFTGNKKEIENDFIFSTIQTISKYEYLQLFDPDEFDYIVIDEVHHAGAPSYLKVLEYFTPKFLLGMTATPERTDGFDIYAQFNYNIAYEIRLQQAMEYDLLCPFHYYGISDLIIEGTKQDDFDQFNRLVNENRVSHIIDTIKQYYYSGNKVHGLVFVSRKEEAKVLSDLFNQRGYRTIALTGEDSEEKRKEMIDRLEMDECPEALDYIFTVDIFNEGVDIPAINQVVMVRPTESSIIFIQQLGRGLRKNANKEYVNIIDMIGNYTKNFLIPIALSGNNTYNKDTLRKFVYDSNNEIYGASTISFDEITKKNIYKAIDVANFSDVQLIKESYQQLKLKLGRIPSLMDFIKYEAIDPIRIFDNKRLGSYHVFLKKYEKDYTVDFDPIKIDFLKFVSTKFASGKRIQELELIKQTILYRDHLFARLEERLLSDYHIIYDDSATQTIINELTHNFATGSAKDAFKGVVFIKQNENDYCISETFKTLLDDEQFYDQMMEVINYGIYKYQTEYSERYKDTDLCLYQKYTYDDVCRLLNWEKSEVALNIGGYKYDKYSNTYPVFINYEKGEVRASIDFPDRFIDDSHLIAISKSKRTVDSDDMQTIINAQENKTNIHLFVRKNKDDEGSKEFYYLGKMRLAGDMISIKMKGTGDNAVEIPYELETPIREDIFDYIVN